MGFIYQRQLPDAYIKLRMLKQRGRMTDEEERYFHLLWNGYIGEVTVDDWLRADPGIEALIIPDLKLEIDRKTVQLDTVMLTGQKLHILEIKHYRGEYENTGSNQWKTPGGHDIQSPFLQLERSCSLVKRYLRDAGFGHILVEGWVLCPHETFQLYGMSKNQPVITRNRWSYYVHHEMKDLYTKPAAAEAVYQKLMKTRLSGSQLADKVMPSMDDLARGIFCNHCHEKMQRKPRAKFLTCTRCGSSTTSEEAITQARDELSLLNLSRIINPSIVYDWTGGILYRRTIERQMHS